MSKIKLLAISLALVVVFSLIGLSSKQKNCLASDYMPFDTVVRNGRAFTQDEACRKAVFTCTIYSHYPKLCKVVQ